MFEIRRTRAKGRGLYATQPIAPGTEILRCPVIVCGVADAGRLAKTVVGDYTFRWSHDDRLHAVVLGLISLVNHADEPTVAVEPDLPAEEMVLRAIAPIGPGEELCLRYRRALTFTPA
jgi:hypothetical protein